MLRKLVLPLILLSLSGCFSASPGGLQGAWCLVEEYDGPPNFITQTLEYTINGNAITRIVAQEILLKTTGERVTLRVEDGGTFSVDTTVSPARMDIGPLELRDYPTAVEFATADAILGNCPGCTELYFGELVAFTLQRRVLYARNGDQLQFKFGTETTYPATLDQPFLWTVNKVFRLFP